MAWPSEQPDQLDVLPARYAGTVQIRQQALEFRIVAQQFAACLNQSVYLLFAQGEAGRNAIEEMPCLRVSDVLKADLGEITCNGPFRC